MFLILVAIGSGYHLKVIKVVRFPACSARRDGRP